MRRVASIGIIALIFAMSIYLLLSPPKTATSLPKEEISSLPSDLDQWLGIYIQGQRVGYSFTKIAHADTGFSVENHSSMTLVMMGASRTLTTHLFAHTDNEYTLQDFTIQLETEGHTTKLEGIIHDTELVLTSYSQGIPNTQTIRLKEKPYLPEAIEALIQKRGLKPGDELTIPYFDPTTQSSTSALIKVFDRETVTVLGEKKVGLRVESTVMGLESILWLDSDYKLIKEASPSMGMEMIPLTREQALAQIEPKDAFDLLSFFAVRLDKPVPDPQTLSYLKVMLENISTQGLDMTDAYQTLIKQEPIIIETHRAALDQLPEMTVPIHEQSEFLKPSVYIQCDNPEIIEQAKRFAGTETNVQKVVARLVEGVYRLLKKNPTASLPSAIDVLRTKEGDCNEHAILFTALARAQGIPTKIYVGLINLQGYAYYYHAWCAVWLGAWVPVDPTFNQFPADVGHLKLKEGEISEQARVLQVVGKLSIKVLEYRQ